MTTNNFPKPREKYYHFKHNPKIDDLNYCYEIVGIGKNTETSESVVIYKPLYDCGIELFVRSLDMFIEIVDKPEYNYLGPRFRQARQILEK